MIQLLLYFLVTFLLVRLLAIRATITNRTLLKFFTTGVLLGAVLLVPIQKMVEPYQEGGLLFYNENAKIHFVLGAVMLMVILMPVGRALTFPYFTRLFSVADVFLLAFATGAGVDFLGILLDQSSGGSPLKQISVFPPLVQEIPEYFTSYHIAGMGWRVALIAMSYFLARKYLPKRIFAILISSAFLLLLAYEIALVKTLNTQVLPTYLKLLFNGSLNAWLAILILIVFSWKEFRKGTAIQRTDLIRQQIKNILNAALALDRKEFYLQCKLFRLHRQAELPITEGPPYNEVFTRYRMKIADQIHAAEDALKTKQSAASSGRHYISFRSGLLPALAFGALLLLLLLPGGMTTIIFLFATVFIVYKYLLTKRKPASIHEGDNIIAIISDKTLVLVGIGALIAGVAGMVTNKLYPFAGVPFKLAGKLEPVYPAWIKSIFISTVPVVPEIFILLMAVFACSLVKEQSWPKKKQPVVFYRNRPFIRLAFTVVILLAAHRFYMWGIEVLHNDYGDVLYYIGTQPAAVPDAPPDLPAIFKGVHFEKDAPFGNNLAAWFMAGVALIAGILTLVLFASIEKSLSRNKIIKVSHERARSIPA